MDILKDHHKVESSLDFKKQMQEWFPLLDMAGVYPLYVKIFTEDEMKTYPQIRGFKGLTECLFKSRVELGLDKSLYQIREWFKKRCELIDGYEFNTPTNKQFDFVKKREDIPSNAINIKARMKSCADMTKKQLSMLVQEVLNYGDDNMINMKESVANEWNSIREQMELRNHENTLKHFGG
jgi:hypothetical protein